MTRWIREFGRTRWVLLIVVGFLLSANISSAEDEGDAWTGELALSITAQSGTVDTFAGSVDAGVERIWDESDKVTARFNGVYGKSRDGSDNPSSTNTIQDSQGLFAGWRHRIHERFFWVSGSELSRDSTQDRRIRVAIDTGPGYRFWQGEKPPKRHLDVTTGLGYRYEVYDGNGTSPDPAAPGDPKDPGVETDFRNYADIVVGFEYKELFFDERVEWTHTGSGRMPANKPSEYILRSEIIVGVPLSEAWSFRTSFLVEYVAEPGDSVVNKTTTRTSLGLGYKF